MGALAHAAALSSLACAFICFELRDPQVEHCFRMLCEQLQCFEVCHIDISDVLSKVCWSPPGQFIGWSRGFHFLRLVLRPDATLPSLTKDDIDAALAWLDH